MLLPEPASAATWLLCRTVAVPGEFEDFFVVDAETRLGMTRF